jgi:hypothetical protein
MSSLRIVLLFAAVHLAALAVGAWAVLGEPAARLPLLWAAMLAGAALFLRLVAPSDWAPLQIIMRPVFALVYRRWLWNAWHPTNDRVIRVTGWRSAIVETRSGQRRHMTACFWGLT